MSKARTFQELATKTRDIEVTIAKRRGTSVGFAESKKDKVEFKINIDNSTKEVMSVFEAKLVRITGKPRQEGKRSTPFKDATRRRLMLKELQENKYMFPDSDLSTMLDDLLKNGVIEIPEPKIPKEVGSTADLLYCKYHRMVSHPLEKSITLKERTIRLIKDETIILDLDDVVETNHISYQTKGLSLIQFGSLEPPILYEH